MSQEDQGELKRLPPGTPAGELSQRGPLGLVKRLLGIQRAQPRIQEIPGSDLATRSRDEIKTVDFEQIREAGRTLQITINEAGYNYIAQIAEALGFDELYSLNQVPPGSLFSIPDGGYIEVIAPETHGLVDPSTGHYLNGVKRVYGDSSWVFHDLDPFLGVPDIQRNGIVFNSRFVLKRGGREQAVIVDKGPVGDIKSSTFYPPDIRVDELEAGSHIISPDDIAQVSSEAKWENREGWEYQEIPERSRDEDGLPRRLFRFSMLATGQIADGVYLSHNPFWENLRRDLHFLHLRTTPTGGKTGGETDPRYVTGSNRGHPTLDLVVGPQNYDPDNLRQALTQTRRQFSEDLV